MERTRAKVGLTCDKSMPDKAARIVVDLQKHSPLCSEPQSSEFPASSHEAVRNNDGLNCVGERLQDVRLESSVPRRSRSRPMSRSSPTEEAAIDRARQLYLKERAEIYRIEGPNGLILRKEEIMRRLSPNKV